jgi:hypothetical protein
MFWKVFNSIVVPVTILIPIISGLYKYKILPFSLKIIWFYLLSTAVINTAATIMGRVYHVNNMPLVHFYTFIEGLLFIWFFQFLSSEANRKWFIILQLVFACFCILNAAFFQSIYLYSSYTRYTESIICILFALKYYAQLALSDNKPLRLPTFYFNTGIFLYFSGSFVLFIFSNVISQKLSPSTMLIFWSGHSSLVLLMYILFSIGFIKCKK